MKINLPKEIRALTATIAGCQNESDRRHADIERANEAFNKAERLTADLQALAERRAQLQAEAFIQRKQVDLSELDAEEQVLESASRAARTEGRTAEIAIGILNEQLLELTTKIEQATEERRQMALRWLDARQELAIDRYMTLLNELGSILAEVAGADGVRGALGDFNHRRRPGEWLVQEWKKIEIPIPALRMETIKVCSVDHRRSPLVWRRDLVTGVAEREALLTILREAGVLETHVSDAAANGAAA